MKITADTNVLVRAITGDNAQQSKAAQTALKNADVVALAIPALCELVWVLSQGYKIRSREITEAIRRLMNGANVVVNRPAAEAGLALLDAGGDFADGAIAYEGNWLGAETLLFFDKNAVKQMQARGGSAHLLSAKRVVGFSASTATGYGRTRPQAAAIGRPVCESNKWRWPGSTLK